MRGSAELLAYPSRMEPSPIQVPGPRGRRVGESGAARRHRVSPRGEQRARGQVTGRSPTWIYRPRTSAPRRTRQGRWAKDPARIGDDRHAGIRCCVGIGSSSPMKYDGSARRHPCRPRTPAQLAALVVTMAKENSGWGYTRIRGALQNLGHTVGRSTIARILAEHGLDPAPGRPLQWKTFLEAHWGAICAVDFFTVESLTLRGLARRHVFFVIDLKSRGVALAGLVHEPHGEWAAKRPAWKARRGTRLSARFDRPQR